MISSAPRFINFCLTLRDVAGNKNETRARGIRFMQSHGNLGETYEAYIRKPKNSDSWGEVILAAGALGSPQIGRAHV